MNAFSLCVNLKSDDNYYVNICMKKEIFVNKLYII